MSPPEDLGDIFGDIFGSNKDSGSSKKKPHEQAEDLAKGWARLVHQMKRLWP